MDDERDVARRMVIGLPEGGPAPAWETDFAAFPPAGVIVFRRDFETLDGLRALLTRLRALARPHRLLVAIDEEGGFVSQLRGTLAVPPNAALLARGAAARALHGHPGDIEWAARVTGERLRMLGVDWVFAPVADVNAEAANPVIGPRAYGTDAASAAHGVAGAVRGFRAAKVACCLKHFPGHGATTLDSHVASPVCASDRATIETRDLEPFRAGRDAGADAVMTAHVRYPALDPDVPATFSRPILHGLLRGTLGFRGLCITDALEMQGASEGRTPAEAAVLALQAGCDLLLIVRDTAAVPAMRAGVARAIAQGRLARADLDASAARIEALRAATPEPTAEETTRPLGSLAPDGLVERLEDIVAHGLVVRGAFPAGAVKLPWRIEDVECQDGPGFRGCLANGGVAMDLLLGEKATGGAPRVEFIALANRAPLEIAEIERLRGLCRAHPTVLVGLMNDAFLDALPEAALRVSALDATPLTRRVVARTVARAWQAAGGAG